MAVTLVVPDPALIGAFAAEIATRHRLDGDLVPEIAKALHDAFTQAHADLTALDGGSLQKRTVTVLHGDLTAAVAGEAQAINVGAVLPANAVVLAHEVDVNTLFSGGGATAVKLDVGGTDADAIVLQLDVFTGALTGPQSPRTGVHAQGKFSAQQLTATFTPDGLSTLLGLTAGELTVTVWFSVLA